MENKTEKKCKKCGEVQPLGEYHKCKDNRDGREGKCKKCKAAMQSERLHRKKNDPEWMHNERKRCRENNSMRSSKIEKARQIKGAADFVKKYNEKYKAACAARFIPKKDGHQNHHWSYRTEHRKDIIQLPTAEHYRVHRFTVYDPERMQYRTVHGVLLDTREAALAYYTKVKSIEDGVYSELEKLK